MFRADGHDDSHRCGGKPPRGPARGEGELVAPPLHRAPLPPNRSTSLGTQCRHGPVASLAALALS